MASSMRLSGMRDTENYNADHDELISIRQGSTEEYFDVQYMFSMILVQNLKFISNGARHGSPQLRQQKNDVFEFLISNTILFIWHLHL